MANYLNSPAVIDCRDRGLHPLKLENATFDKRVYHILAAYNYLRQINYTDLLHHYPNLNILDSDQGTEFYNDRFQQYMRQKNIEHFSKLGSETKAAIVERFHRAITERLYRYFLLVGNKRYVEVLQSFVDSYNETPHKTLSFVAPNNVTENNKEEIKNAVYGTHKVTYAFRRSSKEKFVPEQLVRVSLQKKSFEKGFLRGWSSEV
ncbi:hypothetical protein RvY_00108 [Ramazzottius varieornatus]|uniref:Integrase catalytic domain-containing protein n=1 Tax=Ramazzottius varieornatus TaxID=947166 RepID=A0A1D1UFS3_RAMVA|nr:hypothetical protein RvY_00108 [Ramazzottius varieornatus]